MAGKSLFDIHIAQKAAKAKLDLSQSNPNPPVVKSFVAVTGLDGKLWYIDASNLGQLPALLETTAFIGIETSATTTLTNKYSTECWEHMGFIAFEEARTTVN